jgi:DNA-directed RNA polymerase subunit beta'
MRTFHVGGTASQTFKQPIITTKNEGIVRFNDLVVESTESNFVVLNKNGGERSRR